MNYSALVNKMIVLFLTLAVGYLAARRKLMERPPFFAYRRLLYEQSRRIAIVGYVKNRPKNSGGFC